jgi:septum formation protein
MLKWNAMKLPSIWLASASPRRQEMLKWMDRPFQVLAADIDESTRMNEMPADYVRRLANEKALAAREKIKTDGLIIAADTTVVLGEKIFGKPGDQDEAAAMLKSLRKKEHQVITALVLLDIPDDSSTNETCISTIEMRNYSDEEIRAYVISDDPLDKAGAYAIQHPQFNPVTNFQGCYASVMGMPICHLERYLRKHTDYLPVEVSQLCRKFLDYTCPIHLRIMAGENIG